MLNTRLKFHHLGLAVRKPEWAVRLVTALGYRPGPPVFDALQNVNLMMCSHQAEPAIEIIWPGETAGPIDRLTQRDTAGIVYHICYSTDNLAEALAEQEGLGLRVLCVSPPNPAPLFGGRRVSFYNVIGIGLVEILE